jgi:Caspase domain
MRMNALVRSLVLGFMFAVGLFAEAHAAEQRVALVIGNGAYWSAPELRNSRNDADDISTQLKQLGFSVIDGRDLDRASMQAVLSRFAQRLKGADAGLVYYSGHGLQVNGQNFLVPVDLKYDNGTFTTFELVKVDDVVDALGYTDGVRLLVLDACRDNPFANNLAQNKGTRGAGTTRGLAKIERSQGMLIAYSTQPNAVAADGTGRNSPFTAALVRELQVPGLEVATVFRRVAVNVNRETAGAQTPELSVSLLGDFYLNPQESDISAWQKLGPSASTDGLKTFISRFPTSVMVDAARARLDAIENANQRERLAREYDEKERRLRQELEAAEAGYRKAASELAARRERDARERLADAKSGQAPVAAAPPAAAAASSGAVPEIAVRPPDDGERERQMKEQAAAAERERLASQVAAFEADKARLANERRALELAMSESLARAQADRVRAEKRVAAETARLPVVALDQQRTMVPPAPPRRAASTCQEINARAQLGDISDADRDILKHGCH